MVSKTRTPTYDIKELTVAILAEFVAIFLTVEPSFSNVFFQYFHRYSPVSQNVTLGQLLEPGFSYDLKLKVACKLSFHQGNCIKS